MAGVFYAMSKVKLLKKKHNFLWKNFENGSNYLGSVRVIETIKEPEPKLEVKDNLILKDDFFSREDLSIFTPIKTSYLND